MYQVIYKCKLCGQIETEYINDSEFDFRNNRPDVNSIAYFEANGLYYKLPLKTLYKTHLCKDKSIGIHELIGYKKVDD